MTDSHDEVIGEPVGGSEKENEIKLSIVRERVIFLLNELKNVFASDMRLTFLARDPNSKDIYTFLTEERGKGELIEFLNSMNDPTEVFPSKAGNA